MKNSAFKKATTSLNKFNQKNLWGVSSALSLLEFFTKDKKVASQIFAAVNPVKLNLFTKAIIHSSSRDYKEPIFDSSTFIKVFNILGEALPKPNDTEVDLMVGKAHKSVLLVLTDCTTLLTKLKKVTSRKAEQMATHIISQLSHIPSSFIKTLTFDNDKAFAKHQKMAKRLAVNTYFTRDPTPPKTKAP